MKTKTVVIAGLITCTTVLSSEFLFTDSLDNAEQHSGAFSRALTAKTAHYWIKERATPQGINNIISSYDSLSVMNDKRTGRK